MFAEPLSGKSRNTHTKSKASKIFDIKPQHVSFNIGTECVSPSLPFSLSMFSLCLLVCTLCVCKISPCRKVKLKDEG